MVSEKIIRTTPKIKLLFAVGSPFIPMAAPNEKQEISKYTKEAIIKGTSVKVGYSTKKKNTKYATNKITVNIPLIRPLNRA